MHCTLSPESRVNTIVDIIAAFVTVVAVLVGGWCPTVQFIRHNE